MNDQIRAAVERLFSACLEVTAAGRFHAFCDYQAHVARVQVRLYPASSIYTEKPYPDAVMDIDVKLVPFRSQDPIEHTATALADLNALMDRLYGVAAQKVAA
jgi:hypothetical protein